VLGSNDKPIAARDCLNRSIIAGPDTGKYTKRLMPAIAIIFARRNREIRGFRRVPAAKF
jgi:hypothetical protein